MHKKLMCRGLPFLNTFPPATVDQGEPRVSAFRRQSRRLPLASGGLFGIRGWGNLDLGGERTYHMLLTEGNR